MELGSSAIEREIDRGIDRIFKTKPDLAKFFKEHPRKPAFVTNLAKQLYHADNRKALQSGPLILADTIFQMTKTYCKVCLEHHDQSQLTHAEITRRKDEASRIQNAEAIVKEALPDLSTDDFKYKELSDG